MWCLGYFLRHHLEAPLLSWSMNYNNEVDHVNNSERDGCAPIPGVWHGHWVSKVPPGNQLFESTHNMPAYYGAHIYDICFLITVPFFFYPPKLRLYLRKAFLFVLFCFVFEKPQTSSQLEQVERIKVCQGGSFNPI